MSDTNAQYYEVYGPQFNEMIDSAMQLTMNDFGVFEVTVCEGRMGISNYTPEPRINNVAESMTLSAIMNILRKSPQHLTDVELATEDSANFFDPYTVHNALGVMHAKEIDDKEVTLMSAEVVAISPRDLVITGASILLSQKQDGVTENLVVSKVNEKYSATRHVVDEGHLEVVLEAGLTDVFPMAVGEVATRQTLGVDSYPTADEIEEARMLISSFS